MQLFAQAPNINNLTAEEIRALPANVVNQLPPDQIGLALRKLEEARWASEWPYFRWLHEVLPEPFFQTQGFLVFFLAVAFLYWMLPRRWNSVRVWVLVIASFHFYAAWNASLAFLVTVTATADYLFARWMDGIEHRGRRRAVMWASIIMNLGVLCYFKYRGFFLNELHDFLTKLGANSPVDKFTALDILIPFGISFYTFEAISYAVDVFQRKVKAERSLPHFLLFILFFPHLVAGPIVRAGDFLRQAHRPKRWNWVRVQVGVQFIVLGLFKKMAIADRMAVVSDPVFKNPEAYNTGACWLALLAYSLRIYADFSGYSDMAVGTAHLLGFKLTQNFNMPYFSRNVAEFWHRWHISLSSWLRDYLYIPLGGSRGSAFATHRNLMITMLLGGLWHGSNWSYVIWGGLHGLLLIGHRLLQAFCATRPTITWFLDSKLGTVYRVLATFFLVSLCWVFFRPELDIAWKMMTRLFSLVTIAPERLPVSTTSIWCTVGLVAFAHMLNTLGWWQWVWNRMPPVVIGAAYAVTVTIAMVLVPEQGQSFIYFTF
jgi:alginate O-acetyltransferase complex protein AlgI